ncbi:hypothetical protein MPRF_11120 [Mycolicibacterium parafortuitum]|uniref:Protein-glutamine gamma-glutamyltransferase-like C-terminal domain-containing protein n=1 Tax=Mycolicibacterium parafortuitum TaxID=39692 RepID=A0A7I7TZY3_MYCPF|nr:DUF4129 domain-containing protein [Mycolicibacterium parafortuitum]BBY74213.1 hypothetical protein MPRF_11120 [Mycolicibacterium parafortuitum]
MPDSESDTTESGDHRALTRAIAVVVLLTLAMVSLRGYLPGEQRRPDPEPVDGGSGTVAVIAMLTLSIAALAISILAQALRRSAAPAPADPHREMRARRGALPWRQLLIAAAVLVAWALVLLMLMRWASAPVDDAVAGDVPVPDDPSRPRDAAEPGRQRPTAPQGGNVFGILAVAAMVLLALSVTATLLRRRPREPVAPPVPDRRRPRPRVPGPDLARAAELGLAEMDDPDRDPREAIIACYLAMERELGKSPGTTPQDSDTPSEVLARAIHRQVLQAGHATRLVELFEEARFSPHVMDGGHRADAVAALQAVLVELRVSA